MSSGVMPAGKVMTFQVQPSSADTTSPAVLDRKTPTMIKKQSQTAAAAKPCDVFGWIGNSQRKGADRGLHGQKLRRKGRGNPLFSRPRWMWGHDGNSAPKDAEEASRARAMHCVRQAERRQDSTLHFLP